MENVFCYPFSKCSSRVDESIRVSSLTMTSSRVTCDTVCIDFQRFLSWLVLHQDIRCFEELQVWYHHHHHIRSRGRARHNPQMLWCFSHLTWHRRCTYYRQYESCTLRSQVWDFQMTIVFGSVHIRFFFPVSFVYCFAWPFLYTQCKIYNQDSDERHYFLGKKSIIPFFYRFFPSSSYSDVDCVSALRKCDRMVKDVPLYSAPPITADEWYILIGVILSFNRS